MYERGLQDAVFASDNRRHVLLPDHKGIFPHVFVPGTAIRYDGVRICNVSENLHDRLGAVDLTGVFFADVENENEAIEYRSMALQTDTGELCRTILCKERVSTGIGFEPFGTPYVMHPRRNNYNIPKFADALDFRFAYTIVSTIDYVRA